MRVAERSSRHGDRVWVERGDGSVVTFPRAWTSLAEADPFVVLSEGKACFRPEDLVELTEVIAGIRTGAREPGGREDV